MSDETFFRDPDATRSAAGDMISAGEVIEAAVRKYAPLIEELDNWETYGDDDPGRAFANGGEGSAGYRESLEAYLENVPSAGEGVRVTGEAVEATVDAVVGVDQAGRQVINDSVKDT